MGQALYRTYRSRKLSEIVGQEHITDSLKHAIDKGNISHAYLFTGPRGVGKTSIARILAHEINGLPYNDDSIHLDIIEIDAASNRRIDEIRDLRDKVQIAPTSAKFKVYIIDEVHMLTKEAFNALLKTLEEPPAHVVFILATTEVYKLPETIISRTQRYSFKPVEMDKVIEHLKFIAKKENIKISDEALKLIAKHGEGSFRDSISLLDQSRNKDKEITLNDVQSMLGIAPSELIDKLIDAINAKDVLTIVDSLRQIQLQGFEPAQIAKQLSQKLRESFLNGQSGTDQVALLNLMGKLINVPSSADPGTSLEICLLDAAISQSADTAKSIITAQPASKADITIPVTKEPLKPEENIFAESSSPATKQNLKPLDDKLWAELLNAIKGHHNTLYGIVRQSKPHFSGDKLLLIIDRKFNLKHIDSAVNKKIIAKAVEDLTGKKIIVTTQLASQEVDIKGKAENVEKNTKTAPDNNIDNISNIFGSAELLES